MPPIIVTAANIPDVLAQIAERQDEQSAALELLAEQLADQSIRTDEALHTQAAALRATAAQQSRSISEIAKAVNGSARRAGDNADDGSNANDGDDGSNANDGDDGSNTDGGADDGSNPRRPDRRASGNNPGRAGNGNSSGKPVKPVAVKPEESKAPERKRAHRWI